MLTSAASERATRRNSFFFGKFSSSSRSAFACPRSAVLGVLYVPYPAGGPTDTLARILAELVRISLGRPVIIENVSGAGGSIGCDRRRLREVRICFTRDLEFQDCSPSAQRACRSERLIVPPVRARSRVTCRCSGVPLSS
jgi:hypothetical protein